jgi:pyruvate dehydrogenase E2 component (dihydrolipoamide acetyltransferase)
MSEILEVKVPDIGDLDTVEVVEVLVASGDQVGKEESLITLESDKATMDVPAPASGTVQEVRVKAGDQIHEGTVILVLAADETEASPAEDAVSANDSPEKSSAAEESGSAPADPAQSTEQKAAPAPSPEKPQRPERPQEPERLADAPAATPPEPHAVEVVQADFSRVYASPAVRHFARQLGVDLRRVRGTGRKERILKDDVRDWVKKTVAEPGSPGTPGGVIPIMPAIDFTKFGEIEKIALTRVQKISGPNLQRSWLNAPHVTQHDEADITKLEDFRQKHKAEAKARGFNLTPLAFIMKAVVRALKEFPRLNSSLDPDGEHLILKRYYHSGIAVDTDEGLMVPVIRDVDKKGIIELAEELGEMSIQARDRKLTPDRVRGASFTISSLGGIGGGHFTPIINAPEVAILGVGRHRQAPVWNGSEFEPRLILPLSLSYDHRVIDGAMGVRFTTYLAGILGDIRRLLL